MQSHASIWNVASICLAVCAMGLLSVPAADATTVTLVQDTFNTGPTTVNGRTPDAVDLPGSNWISSQSISGNQLIVGGDGATVLSIASAGAYTKPTVLTISADLNLNGMTGAASLAAEGDTAGTNGTIIRGITLGFFDPATIPTGGFFGERRGPFGVTYNDLGYLLLVRGDATAANLNGDVLAQVSTYGPSNTPIPLTGSHHLSYTVDTTTGSISGVTFDGFLIDFGVSTAGLFTDARTNYAGNYAASGAGNTFGFLDNFTITTPEPASLSLLAAGGMLLLRRRRA